jgi:Cation transporting ATPase, C-terminus
LGLLFFVRLAIELLTAGSQAADGWSRVSAIRVEIQKANFYHFSFRCKPVNPLSNPFLFFATAVAFLVHFAALYWPWTQFILRVKPIELTAWVRIVLVGASILVTMELHKLAHGALLNRKAIARSGAK